MMYAVSETLDMAVLMLLKNISCRVNLYSKKWDVLVQTSALSLDLQIIAIIRDIQDNKLPC